MAPGATAGQNAPMAVTSPRESTGRRVWRAIWITLLALVVLFHLAGAWYFGEVLVRDGFEPTAYELTPNVRVTAAGEGSVELSALDELDRLERSGVFGLGTAAGFGQVTASSSGRAYESLEGSPPREGDEAEYEPFAFPDDAEPALGAPGRMVTIPGPLGDFEALEVAGSGPDWAIVVHGKGAPIREGFRMARPLAAAGYPILLITYRNDPGQPADPSGFYQYGATEWEDVAAAVDYARSQGAQRVVLAGNSTGAALALAYAYRAPADRIAGIVLDAPNIDMEATVDFGASQRSLPVVGLPIPVTVTFLAKWYASLRTGVSWDTIDYVSRADRLAVPTLVFHGTEDATVPLDTSLRFQEARPQFVALETVEGAGHVESWNVDPDAYEARVLEFLSALRGG